LGVEDPEDKLRRCQEEETAKYEANPDT